VIQPMQMTTYHIFIIFQSNLRLVLLDLFVVCSSWYMQVVHCQRPEGGIKLQAVSKNACSQLLSLTINWSYETAQSAAAATIITTIICFCSTCLLYWSFSGLGWVPKTKILGIAMVTKQ